MSSPATGRPFVNRVQWLGQYLFELQEVENFESVALSRLRRESIASVVAELRVAYLIRLAGHEVSFNVPSGSKGDDYDLRVVFDGQPVAVEVKAKGDTARFSRLSLRKIVAKARRQLPP